MESAFTLDEVLPTDLEKISPFIEMVSRKTFAVTASTEDAYAVKLALEEALTNAMRHGNLLEPSRTVTVAIAADREKISLDVHDQGSGFDHDHLPDPTSAPNADRPSGRGVFLMRSLMDSVAFYDNGSGVTMIKRFRPR